MTGHHKNDTIAVWAITPNVVKIARKIASALPTADVYLSTKLETSYHEAIFFDNLSDWLAKQFNSYGGHIFIIATGIVVRSIASRRSSFLIALLGLGSRPLVIIFHWKAKPHHASL